MPETANPAMQESVTKHANVVKHVLEIPRHAIRTRARRQLTEGVPRLAEYNHVVYPLCAGSVKMSQTVITHTHTLDITEGDCHVEVLMGKRCR